MTGTGLRRRTGQAKEERIGQETRKMMGTGFWRGIGQAKEERIGQVTEER